MIKILAITDIHATHAYGDILQKYRKNVLPDIVAKIEWVVEEANHGMYDVIIVAGDWFHNVDVPYSVQSAIIEAFLRFPFPVIGVTGQHDLPQGGNWRLGPAYALPFGVAGEFNWTQIIARQKIKAYPYGTPVEEMTHTDGAVIVVHDMLVKYPVKFEHKLLTGFEYDLPGDKPRVVISGDFHPGYKPTWVNNTLFINPGTMTRQHPKNFNRMPQYASIVIDGDTVTAEYKPIEAAKSGEDVFDLQRFSDDLKHIAKLDKVSNFTTMLAGLGATDMAEIDWNALGLDDSVRDIITKAIEDATNARDNY